MDVLTRAGSTGLNIGRCGSWFFHSLSTIGYKTDANGRRHPRSCVPYKETAVILTSKTGIIPHLPKVCGLLPTFGIGAGKGEKSCIWNKWVERKRKICWIANLSKDSVSEIIASWVLLELLFHFWIQKKRNLKISNVESFAGWDIPFFYNPCQNIVIFFSFELFSFGIHMKVYLNLNKM